MEMGNHPEQSMMREAVEDRWDTLTEDVEGELADLRWASSLYPGSAWEPEERTW